MARWERASDQSATRTEPRRAEKERRARVLFLLVSVRRWLSPSPISPAFSDVHDRPLPAGRSTTSRRCTRGKDTWKTAGKLASLHATRTFDLSRLDKLDRRQLRHRAASSARVCSAARWSDTFVAADPMKNQRRDKPYALLLCSFGDSSYHGRVRYSSTSAHFQKRVIRRALSICRRLAEKRQLSFADSKYTCSRRFSFKKSLYLWPTFLCTLFLPEVACTGCGSIDKDSLDLLHTRKTNERFYRYPYKNIETHHAPRHRKYVD